MTEPRERAVEAKMSRWVDRLGGMSVKMAPTLAGMPDRLLLLPGGRVILAEVKATKGRLSPIQKARHKEIRSKGHKVVTVYGMGGLSKFADEYATTGELTAEEYK